MDGLLRALPRRTVVTTAVLTLSVLLASPPPPGPAGWSGAELYRHYCAACHGRGGEGRGPNTLHLPKPLADLDRIARRSTEADWLKVLADGTPEPGHAYRRNLTEPELRRVVRYCREFPDRERASRPDLSAAPDPQCVGCHDMPGDEILARSGCGNCHGSLEMARVSAPTHEGISGKFRRDWLRRYLGHSVNRRLMGHTPMTPVRMPDFRLDPGEVDALLAYLMPGPEAETTPASAASVAEGKALFEGRGCTGCHTITPVGARFGTSFVGAGGIYQPGFVARWLLHLREIRPETPMPDPGLSEAEARAIEDYLLGLRPDRTPEALPGHAAPETTTGPEATAGPTAEVAPPTQEALRTRGQALYQDLGCHACHEGLLEAPEQFLAPDLAPEGVRVSRDWLYDYTRKPDRIRPHLPGRMPTFRLTVAEQASLVDAFERLAHERFGEIPEVPAPPPGTDGGSPLEEFGCVKCHAVPVGSPAVEVEEETRPVGWRFAPRLQDLSRRLRYGWILAWLRGPARFIPNTAMPDFQLGEEEVQALARHVWHRQGER